MTAVAALAFMAPAASAQVEVESVSEDVMCDDTAAGFCEINIGAELATLQVHTFFGEFTYRCDVNVPTHVQSDGSGSTETVTIVDESGGTNNCDDLTACEQPWTGQAGEPAAGVEDLTVDICITNGLVTCEGLLHSGPLTDTGSGYSAEITDIEIEGDPNCEFTGDYSADDIQIHH